MGRAAPGRGGLRWLHSSRPLKPMGFLSPVFSPRSVGACAEGRASGWGRALHPLCGACEGGAASPRPRWAALWGLSAVSGTSEQPRQWGALECSVGCLRQAWGHPNGLSRSWGRQARRWVHSRCGQAFHRDERPSQAGPHPEVMTRFTRVHATGAWAAGDAVRSRFTRGAPAPASRQQWDRAAHRLGNLQPRGRRSRAGFRAEGRPPAAPRTGPRARQPGCTPGAGVASHQDGAAGGGSGLSEAGRLLLPVVPTPTLSGLGGPPVTAALQNVSVNLSGFFFFFSPPEVSESRSRQGQRLRPGLRGGPPEASLCV